MSSSAPNEHRGQCVRLAACVVALVLWMGFVFFMSANDGDHSQGMSDGVTSLVLSAVWPGYSGMLPDEQMAVVESLSFPVRKAGHFSEYAVLGLLAFATLRQGQVLRSSQALLNTRKIAPAAAGAVVVAFLYACFDEFHQLFVAGRSGQPFDVGVDTAGALVAVAIAVAVARMRERRGL